MSLPAEALPRARPPIFFLLFLTFSVFVSGDKSFDHNDQHCHDVSVWGDVEYKEQECQKCETDFEQECKKVVKEVCAEVPETRCELIPWAECKLYEEEQVYKETEVVVHGQYVPWECSNTTREEMHIKLVPKCVNVTRQDCVTKWVVRPNGEKVWDGNEQCTPVTWENCTLHEEARLFNQTYTQCSRTGTPIPTMTCELVDKVRCEVMKSVNCTCEHYQQCVTLVYDECHERAKPLNCESTFMSSPFQPKIHRVKCLLVDNNAAPELSVEESAAAAENKLEGKENGPDRRGGDRDRDRDRGRRRGG